MSREASGLPIEDLTRLWRARGFLEPAGDDVLTDMDVGRGAHVAAPSSRSG